MTKNQAKARVRALFGRRVRAHRLAQGWTQGRLADHLGMSQGLVSKIEAGSIETGLFMGLRLCDLLGIDSRDWGRP